MWSRYSRYLSQRAPEDGERRYRDLLETHSQSLGFRQLEKVKIDCSFLPNSRWGLLETVAGSPAWLLYLQLQFSQPADCTLANATIELTFEKLPSTAKDPIHQSKLGPILTEYFGPRDVNGCVASPLIASKSPAFPVDISTNETSSGYVNGTDTPWSLNGYTWPVDGDESGLHRRVEWVLKEVHRPHQTIFHRDQIKVGLVLLHDSEPFIITVHIAGQLQGNQRWLKFPSSTESTRSRTIRVSPSTHPQAPLDDTAKRLNEDMTELIHQGNRMISHSSKRPIDDSENTPSRLVKRVMAGSQAATALLPTKRQMTTDDYLIGWICALPLEMAAARAMLDEVHNDLPVSPNDHNNYTLGSIGPHNIVLACLPAGVYGTTSAATVATRMVASFPSIRFSLMVGIGGGVPNSKADIRLGDVIVSEPTNTLGGVVQYDLGKRLASGGFEQTGTLNKPPLVLLATVAKIQAEHMVRGYQIGKFMSEMVTNHPLMRKFTHRGRDHLFKAEYDHRGPSRSCESCDPSQHVARLERAKDSPMVHYGAIASGNQVMKDGNTRDRLAKKLGVICFEMEAAGLMDSFPCLVIRGVCDYADSHKNDDWQEYAAASAAAYAKEFLCMTPARHIEITPAALSAET